MTARTWRPALAVNIRYDLVMRTLTPTGLSKRVAKLIDIMRLLACGFAAFGFFQFNIWFKGCH